MITTLILIGLSIIIILSLSISLTISVRKLIQTKTNFAATQAELIAAIDKQHEQDAKLIELQEQVKANFATDSLTGLPSRKIFEDRFSQLLSQSKRYNLLFAVLFLNLDGLKIVNDALGLDAGDEVLKEVAARIQENIRQLDTVSRFGGDQFVLLLAQVFKPESSAQVVQRLLDAIAQPFKMREQEIFITATVGIAVYPTDGKEEKILLSNADNALRQAKMRGRNSYQFYRKEMYNASRRDLTLTSSLHSATIYQDFLIYYQPQVNIQTKTLAGMDTVLRWEHPDFGLIEYNEFLRFAENSGNILVLGEWILRQACDQFRHWVAQGFNPQKLSVNISLRQLENPHFIYKLSQILQEMKLDPSILLLEISEVSLMAKLDIIGKVLNMLKHLGVRVGVNDFGTGNIALRLLPSFQLDSLKIASSLIQEITLKKETAAIVKMIVALANTLGVEVIASGVESKEQIYLLKEMGCHLVQGNIFTPPLLPHEFSTSLEKVILEQV